MLCSVPLTGAFASYNQEVEVRSVATSVLDDIVYLEPLIRS